MFSAHGGLLPDQSRGGHRGLSLIDNADTIGEQEYFLYGTDGIIRTPEESAALEVFTRYDCDQTTVRPSQFGESGGVTDGHSAADLFEMYSFFRCLRSEETPPAMLLDAKKAAAVALGAEAAIDERSVVEIDANHALIE